MSDPSHLIFNILIFTGILVVLLTPFLECPLNYSNKSVRLKICKILNMFPLYTTYHSH